MFDDLEIQNYDEDLAKDDFRETMTEETEISISNESIEEESKDAKED